MDLTLSRKGDYVVRAAVALARGWDAGGYRKIREVSEEMKLPLSYTPQILAALAHAGLAKARAGRDGGFRLERPPAEITLLEVVEAGEGPLSPRVCALRGGPCRWDSVCALHPAWSAATKSLCNTLQRQTLAGVAMVDEALEAGKLPIPRDSHRTGAREQLAQTG